MRTHIYHIIYFYINKPAKYKDTFGRLGCEVEQKQKEDQLHI